MTSEQFYEILGHIDEQYLEEARQPSKCRKTAWLKWTAAATCLCLLTLLFYTFFPIHKQENHGTTDAVPAPMITILGKNYIAPDMPVGKLPSEYRYLRNLTAKEANGTDLAGCAIYVDPQDTGMSTLYLYQECGTPIDERTVDNTQRQWAYVKWIAYESE